MLTLYGLKNCDTCRKALKQLDAAEKNVAFHDVREDGVSKKQIESWAKSAGWEKLLNKSSTTWRALGAADKQDMDEKKAIALMAAHPALIKRPVIKRGDTEVYVGWSKDVQQKLGV